MSRPTTIRYLYNNIIQFDCKYEITNKRKDDSAAVIGKLFDGKTSIRPQLFRYGVTLRNDVRSDSCKRLLQYLFRILNVKCISGMFTHDVLNDTARTLYTYT